MTGNAERRPAAPAAAPATEGRPRSAPLRWFSPLPVALLKDPSIAAEAKVLAGLLLHYDGPNGCYPRIESLMRDLGVSKNTVIRLLEELERYGFLTREKRGRNNRYHLTPAYVPPARPDDITLTGDLGVENVRLARPVKRATLHKRRPEPMLPLAAEQVPPVEPIPIGRGARPSKKVPSVEPIGTPDVEAGHGTAKATQQVPPMEPNQVAPEPPVTLNRFHAWNPDSTKNQESNKNQQQQKPAAAGTNANRATIELTLINEAVAPDDAVRWAADLDGLPLDDIRAALKIMRAKPAYRRREIARPGAYMRTLCKTQVHTDRELAEHDARRSRSAKLSRAEHPDAGPPAARPHEPITGSRSPQSVRIKQVHDDKPQAPSNAEQLAALDPDAAARVDAHARRLCPAGPTSPTWPAAVAIALQAEARALPVSGELADP